mgnify:CR=1 FL=1
MARLSIATRRCTASAFDRSVLEFDHAVGGRNGLRPVGDDDSGQRQPHHGAADQAFGVDIEVAGGLVEDQDLWSLVQRPGEQHALLLSFAELGILAMAQLGRPRVAERTLDRRLSKEREKGDGEAPVSIDRAP